VHRLCGSAGLAAGQNVLLVSAGGGGVAAAALVRSV
jgi:hypothetical protein